MGCAHRRLERMFVVAVVAAVVEAAVAGVAVAVEAAVAGVAVAVRMLWGLADDVAEVCQYLVQHTATHCNTLQHTATHCNLLHLTATHTLKQ